MINIYSVLHLQNVIVFDVGYNKAIECQLKISQAGTSGWTSDADDKTGNTLAVSKQWPDWLNYTAQDFAQV